MHKDYYPRLFLPHFILILLLSLAGCRKAEKPSLSPQELAVQQTKVIYQQQTRQAAVELTRCSQVGNCDPLSKQSPGSPVATVIDPLSTTPGISPTPTYTAPATTAALTTTLSDTTPGITPSATNTVPPVFSTVTPQTPTAASYPVATNPLTAPTSTPTRTATRTPTATQTATTIHTATQTATPQSGWAGEWVVYLEQKDGSYLSSTINISVDGTQLGASATIGGIAYTYSGTIYNDGQIATGSWVTATADGWFWWTTSGIGQFTGSNEARLGFCGARIGLSRPQPCKELPTN